MENWIYSEQATIMSNYFQIVNQWGQKSILKVLFLFESASLSVSILHDLFLERKWPGKVMWSFVGFSVLFKLAWIQKLIQTKRPFQRQGKGEDDQII